MALAVRNSTPVLGVLGVFWEGWMECCRGAKDLGQMQAGDVWEKGCRAASAADLCRDIESTDLKRAKQPGRFPEELEAARDEARTSLGERDKERKKEEEKRRKKQKSAGATANPMMDMDLVGSSEGEEED